MLWREAESKSYDRLKTLPSNDPTVSSSQGDQLIFAGRLRLCYELMDFCKIDEDVCPMA